VLAYISMLCTWIVTWSPFRLWVMNLIFLVWMFFWYNKGHFIKVQLVMWHVNQESFLVWGQHARQIVLVSCLAQTHDFFIVHYTNNVVIHHQLVHVSPNQPIYRETYLWMNKRLLLDWHGSFQWLQFWVRIQ
jgi:hypothetical protein